MYRPLTTGLSPATRSVSPCFNSTSKEYRIATNGVGAGVEPSGLAMMVSATGGLAALEPVRGFKRQYARATITRSKRHKAMYIALAPLKRNHAKAAPCPLTSGAGGGATIRPELVTS